MKIIVFKDSFKCGRRDKRNYYDNWFHMETVSNHFERRIV